jgi:uncharacterized paraquat-inducible protein A
MMITCHNDNICDTEELFMCPECYCELDAKEKDSLEALMAQPDPWMD